MGKYVIKKGKSGSYFVLKAANGEPIGKSEDYSSEAACKNGIESVKKNAPIANLEDQTVEGGKSLQLKAILDPVDPTNKKLTWTVSSNNVGAKISSSGKLTTKKVTKDTKVMVTVSSNDGTGLTATCFVTITPSVKK